MFLALREIRHEPGRFALIVAVITLVSYLTFFLASLASGLAYSYRAVVDGWDAGTILVTEASNENLSASRLTSSQVAACSALAEEAGSQASSLVAVSAVAQPSVEVGKDSQTKTDVFAFGLDLEGPLSPTVVSGREIADPGTEVLVDETLQAEGVTTGDTFHLLGSDHTWSVVGLTRGTTFQAAPVVTVDAAALQEYAPPGLSPAVSAVVLTDNVTQDPATDTATSEAGLTSLTSEELIQTLPGYAAQVLTFSLMIGSLVVVASVVLAIFLYVLTLQKRPALGILKARGVPTGYLIRSGVVQTVVLAASGVVLGLLLVVGTSPLLPSAVPFLLSPWLDAVIAVLFVVVSVLGGVVSVRVVAGIDPVEAIA
ncbi:FtsX-like permease family protein [Actinomyces sp. 2119]|uniref:FtsX-like permease family protein n=1 Tax=Actinomyces lilanjuaniae TaxID=2321394 RepID=A0ABN5PSW1_9ACTO|nr:MULTISPECIES: FtsX-like permease family protein [Actinomyces]AYD89796.1 FtsX-like permease family protein [Actinomyces lilanjuaniae]RJF44771.1 FtsX-like permease family protein [Actinomyces sp. 2119]